MQDFITLISNKMQIITFQNGEYLCVSSTRQQGKFWIMQDWLKIKGRLQDIWTEMNVHMKIIT